ncbi:serine hydrolase domain-containing protein [Streptomyces coeruleorubidus]|uniref:serine hydrolase domain-containing protein n=1 Tax=Streptomyces coeruleorubidus TaxID=116188 RepID=UPI003411B36E
MGGMTTIHGEVTAGFEPVREAFAANFARHGDIGAAVCVYRDGRPVVDLWGGISDSDTGRLWSRDTLQLVYSATKGATATAAHLLVQRGLLDLDAPVAEYWPEFAANGKADLPVRWLLTHQAGLAALDRPVPLPEALAWEPMVAALAAQRPLWAPGTAHGYHGRTWGWLVGEVIRRVSGRTPGRFFAEEIAAPLGLDFFIGLPRGNASGSAGWSTSSQRSTSPPLPLSRSPMNSATKLPPGGIRIRSATGRSPSRIRLRSTSTRLRCRLRSYQPPTGSAPRAEWLVCTPR